MNRSLLLSFPYLLKKASLLPFLGKQSHSSPDSRAISLVTSALRLVARSDSESQFASAGSRQNY